MDNTSGSPQEKRPAEEVLKEFGQKYSLVGNWRVKPWQAWVAIGATVGILLGVLYVANRSGKFSAGEAASKKQTLTLQSPNGGEILLKGKKFEIRWSSVAPVKKGDAKKVDIFVYQPEESTDCKKAPCPLRPLQSLTGFSVAKETENDGIFEWVVSEKIPDGKYVMRINISGNDRDADESDTPFKIATPPRVTVISPNGGETWTRREAKDILWRSANIPSPITPVPPCSPRPDVPCPVPPTPTPTRVVDIYLESRENINCEPGATCASIPYTVAKGTPDDGSFTWAVGKDANGRAIPDGKYVVRVATGAGDQDQSDAPFSIVSPLRAALNVSIDQLRAQYSAGANGATLANIRFSTLDSPEDIRVTSLKLRYETDSGSTLVNSCSFYDGPVALNTGANVVNPNQDGLYAFYFNSSTVLTAGKDKVLALRCNIPSSAAGGDTVEWKFEGGGSVSAVGATSGASVPVSIATAPDNQNRVTINAIGLLNVSLDLSSPAGRLVPAGLTDVPATILRFKASYESIGLFSLGVQCDCSNLAAVVKISAWDGVTKVGEAIFSGGADQLLRFSQPIMIPANGEKLLTIKTDVGSISTLGGARAGDMIAINYDGDRRDRTQGVGQVTGKQIASDTLKDTNASKVVVFKSIPVLTKVSVPSTILTDGDITLYRFSIAPQASNNSTGVSLYRFTFGTTLSDDDGDLGDLRLSGLKLFAYSDSNFSSQAYASSPLNNGPYYSLSAVNEGTGGNPIYFNPVDPTSQVKEAITVPSSATRYFELRGTVLGSDAGDSITVNLQGDSSLVPVNSANYIDGVYASDFENSFIWSGNSTTSLVLPSTNDWTNGYLVPGLSLKGMSSNTFSK